MIGRLVRSVCVAYLYVCHIPLLRLIGPTAAIVLTRGVAYGHWLLSFVVGQRRTKAGLSVALPRLQPEMSLATAMRRYLICKHQRFVEWYTYPTRRSRRFVKRTYAEIEGRDYLDTSLAQGRGVIVLVFHYGMAKMVWPALMAAGYEPALHVFRGATYAGETFGPVAKLALNCQAKVEAESGLKMIYHRPLVAFRTLMKHLGGNGMLGVNADGMMGTDFVDLPFCEGTMSFPRGLARLAAHAGAPIVPVYALHEGLTRHRMILHEPIYCKEDTPQVVDNCILAYTRIFEDYVRRYPWAWWTWRRLDVEEKENGKLHYAARALKTDEGSYHAPRPGEDESAVSVVAGTRQAVQAR